MGCSAEKRSRLGSPPRGRGKAEQQAYEQLQSGITPAQAGKSRPSPASEMPTKDYPRMGGEKKRRALSVSAFLGSPPRGRGKDAGLSAALPGCRITPARAGKSLSLSGWSSGRQDHPRMGGEKPFLFYGGSSDSGSPPHRRGKVRNERNEIMEVRITPA